MGKHEKRITTAQLAERLDHLTQSTSVIANAMAGGLRGQLGAFMGYSHKGQRDLYKVFGYERVLQFNHYLAMYQRGDLANRIVGAFPQATWREVPIVKDEDGDSVEKLDNKGRPNKSYSPFAAAWVALAKKHKIYSYLERADRISGIGHYGVLLMGFADGKPLSEPLEGKPKLTYMVPYPEGGAVVNSFEMDPANERYGLPKSYNLRQINVEGGQNQTSRTISNVHPSRVIHIAEFLDSDDVYGQPRLRAVFNRLMDLEKVVGGGAEMFWLNANRGLLFSADPAMKLDAATKTALSEQAEEFANQQRRMMVGQGFTAQNMGSDVADPEMHSSGLLDIIAGTTGIPKRILIGSERGELASSQDENAWSLRIEERRTHFAAAVLTEVIQKLIDTGNLIAPKGEWSAEWPRHTGQDPEQQARIGLLKTQAIAAYANSPEAPFLVPPQEFRRDVVNLPPESEFELPEEPADIDESDPNLRDDPAADPPADPKEDDPAKEDPATNASEPRTLYLYRNVLNVGAIKKWAKEQGLKGVQDGLHVTIVYSRAKFDWMKAPNAFPFVPTEDDDGGLMIQPNSLRVVEEIGSASFEAVDGVVVRRQAIALLFNSAELGWRHDDIVRAGASHDFPDYQPHITITYDAQGDDFDLSKVVPYDGAIALGPEQAKQIDE